MFDTRLYRTRAVTLFAIAFVLGLAMSGNALLAAGKPACSHVEGKLSEAVTSIDVSHIPPEFLTTAGPVIGVLSGQYNFTLVSLTPTVKTPGVFLFEATSTIDTKHGDLWLSEAGSVDFGTTGNIADLWTVSGGTGKWENATGQIFAVGNFNVATGTGEVRYSGEVCTK